MVTKVFCSLLLITFAVYTARASDYCKDLSLGWHFYCDPEKVEERQDTQMSVNQIQSARAELEQIQQRLEDLKIQAVMYPTHENIKSYMAYQKEQLDRASIFSEIWSKVLWSTPELDYTVKSPINTVGNELRYEIKNKKQKDSFKHIRQRYGLFFFYNGACIYCQKFSPILHTFAQVNDLSVIAISMDGKFLPEWPESFVNQGQALRFGMSDKPVPAVMLFDNEHKKVIPVGFGLLSVSELEERIYQLARGGTNND